MSTVYLSTPAAIAWAKQHIYPFVDAGVNKKWTNGGLTKQDLAAAVILMLDPEEAKKPFTLNKFA
jgi:hypothetical protein